jgi:hypothetical protein
MLCVMCLDSGHVTAVLLCFCAFDGDILALVVVTADSRGIAWQRDSW